MAVAPPRAPTSASVSASASLPPTQASQPAAPPDGVRRALAALRRERARKGDAVDPVEVARRVLALHGSLEASLARRLVASLLGAAEAELPAALDAEWLRPPEARRVAAIPIEEAAFAVVDLETTGLSADACDILEIGAVRVRRLAVGDAFESLVRPPTAVPRRITALTGIDDAAVADAPPLAPVLRRFRAWLDTAPRAPFVAHNASFDAGFVRAALARERLGPLGVPVLCTRMLARRIAPEVGRYSLDHLSAHFGVSNRARHRALGDAAATARIWVELLDLARRRHAVRTLGDLLDLQERSPGPRRRRRTHRARRAGRG